MRTSTIVWTMLLVAPIAAGCASDPNKKLKEARAEEAEAMREQRVERIDQTKDNRVEAIDNRTDRREDFAEALPEGSDQRAKAQAQMTAARQTYQAETQARLQKIDAKLVETQRKLQIAGGRAKTSTWDRVNLATRLRAGLTTQLNGLMQVPHERWGDETKRIDTRVDELESAVDDVKSDVDGLMP